VARALAAMSPGAVNVGRLDLASGVNFTLEVGKKSGLPWLSSNIRLPGNEAPFPTFKKLKWGELDVVVVAVTPKHPRLDPGLGIEVLDPVAAITEALAEAGAADVVIALSDLGYQEEHILARALPQLHLIVGGGSGNRMIREPLKLGSTLLLRVADRGRHLGVFKAIPTDGKFQRPFGWERTLAASSEALEAFGSQLAQARGDAPNENDPVLKTITELQNRAEKTITRIPGTRYTNKVIFLDRKIADDPATARAVAEFKEWQKKLGARINAEAAKQRSQAAAPPSPKKTTPAKPAVKASAPAAPKPVARNRPARAQPPKTPPKKQSWNVGTLKCRACHQNQYKQWIATDHSRSAAVLPPDKISDAGCRSCHIIRLEVERGFLSEGFVGCESCHGEGSGHGETKAEGITTKPPKSKITLKVPQERCEQCHRGEHKETFVFEQDYQKVRCDR
jgi:hypothetical protein